MGSGLSNTGAGTGCRRQHTGRGRQEPDVSHRAHPHQHPRHLSLTGEGQRTGVALCLRKRATPRLRKGELHLHAPGFHHQCRHTGQRQLHALGYVQPEVRMALQLVAGSRPAHPRRCRGRRHARRTLQHAQLQQPRTGEGGPGPGSALPPWCGTSGQDACQWPSTTR